MSSGSQEKSKEPDYPPSGWMAWTEFGSIVLTPITTEVEVWLRSERDQRMEVSS